MTARVIEAAPGTVDVVLRLRGAGGHVTVTADPATSRATVTLRPAREGDALAEQSISAAAVTTAGPQLRVTVPKPEIHTNRHIGSSGGGVVITGGSTVVAGSIGGRGNFGTVAIGTTASSGVIAEIQVPPGSDINVIAQDSDVVICGRVGTVDADTAGNVRVQGE